jgi:DNA-binding transcriptional LysR family regulator
MRLNKVDLNLFVVLDAIYMQGNLTRAAEVLCITQPAVSNALARLRGIYDDALFVRTGKGMVPTPLTENIMPGVQAALQLLNASLQEAQLFDPFVSEKTFRLSMNDMAEAMIMPKLLSQLQQHAPKAGIECCYVPREEIERELAAGSLDIALDAPFIAVGQMQTQALLKQRYACAVRRDHPKIGDTISLDEYLALDHLQVSSRRKGRGYEDIGLNRLGRQRKIKMRVQHYQVAPLLVAQTDMALTVPISMAQNYDLKILELPYSLPALDWNIYWHKSADQDQANLWLRSLIAGLTL